MHVVIIGNGIAGVTAALRVRRHQPSWRITMISGESDHHYSRPALMYIFMGHMRYRDTKPYEDRYWRQRRIDLVRDWVTGIDVGAKRLRLHRGAAIAYDRLLIATGSKSNRFGWPGQDLDGVQGLYGLQDLVLLNRNVERCRHAVIVGGGLIGIELAEMLHTRNIGVTFLVRERSYWDNVLPPEESAMINHIVRGHGMDLRLETELAEILDDGRGRVRGVRTSRDDVIECQLVGLTAGVRPNLDILGGSGIETGRGVLVDQGLGTSVPDVFAAGDCAEIRSRDPGARNLLQQVWYTGRMQGEVAGDVIAGRRRIYDPGIWYNSAKFFDLEYQVYGRVNLGVPGERSLHWEHPNGRHSVRIVYTGESVIGFNLMGIRYRHEVCERWIRERRPIAYVLQHLGEANFDPEFHRRHEAAIVRAFRDRGAGVGSAGTGGGVDGDITGETAR